MAAHNAAKNTPDTPSNPTPLMAVLPRYHNVTGEALVEACIAARDDIFNACITPYIRKLAKERLLTFQCGFHEDDVMERDGIVIYARSQSTENVPVSIVLHAETDMIIVSDQCSMPYSPRAAQQILESQIQCLVKLVIIK